MHSTPFPASGAAYLLNGMNAKTAATVHPLDFDSSALGAVVPDVLTKVADIRRAHPDIEGWVNVPLFNETGSNDDLRLTLYQGSPRPTQHAADLPAAAAVVLRLLELGFAVKQARFAVLGPRELLRCHVDMFIADRLIVPFNEQGTDFRHVVGDVCVAMRAGEVWSIAGQVCHGAANIGVTGHRVALLVDADPHQSTAPAWFASEWRIPAERVVHRGSWMMSEFGRINSLADDAMERAWLAVPFEFAVSPEDAYSHLAVEWDRRGRPDRAEHWRQRSCQCVPD